MTPHALTASLRTWMFQDALPFWAEYGVDRVHGGVVESLSLDGQKPSGVDFKRLRVACRQLYVFCHAEKLGWRGAGGIVDSIARDMVSQFWLGKDDGWARRVNTAGIVIDRTPDLYDYAFALFALGWWLTVRKDARALDLAHQTLDILEARFRHPNGLGFHASLPASLPREQNPHMHLMEASLVLTAATGDARFERLATSLADLFSAHLCKRPGAILPEFFDDAWRPIAGDKGRRVEPGHQFEWAWILAQHKTISGADHSGLVADLVSFAEAHGVDPSTKLTVNSVRDDGVILDAGSRTWPNTERIKGWIGHAQLNGVDPTPAIASSVEVLFSRFLNPAPNGCWIDAYGADGATVVNVIPASTLYHVFLAFAEAIAWLERPQ